MDNSNSLTSASLLGRICSAQTDETAWAEFIQRYGPRILGWCRQCGLQTSDAEDVTQTVLTGLFCRLRTFQYDPDLSFRGWLHRVTQNALNDFFDSQQRQGRTVGGLQAMTLIASAQARELLETRLEELFDLELLEEAMVRVQRRVTPIRWQAYYMTAVEGSPGEEVAEVLKMKLAVVYSTKCKVLQMIKQEIENLEEAPASVVVPFPGRDGLP